MTQHSTGTREEWLQARGELLERGKQLTRASDEVARQRQELPWARIDEPYEFETPEGSKTLIDFTVFTEVERRTGRGWNFGTPKHADEINVREHEIHGMSTFVLEDGVAYHAYSTYDRGTDAVNGTWQLLDRGPKDRDEGNHPDWPRRRYEFEA